MAVLAVAVEGGDEGSDEEVLPDVQSLKCLWKETSQKISLSDGGGRAMVQRWWAQEGFLETQRHWTRT